MLHLRPRFASPSGYSHTLYTGFTRVSGQPCTRTKRSPKLLGPDTALLSAAMLSALKSAFGHISKSTSPTNACALVSNVGLGRRFR